MKKPQGKGWKRVDVAAGESILWGWRVEVAKLRQRVEALESAARGTLAACDIPYSDEKDRGPRQGVTGPDLLGLVKQARALLDPGTRLTAARRKWLLGQFLKGTDVLAGRSKP